MASAWILKYLYAYQEITFDITDAVITLPWHDPSYFDVIVYVIYIEFKYI